MKKLVLWGLCLGLLLLFCSACAKKHNANGNGNAYYGGEPMDFKSFKLVQTDTTAQRRVYEGYKTESGVHLEYYISTEMWSAAMSFAQLTQMRAFFKSCAQYSAATK